MKILPGKEEWKNSKVRELLNVIAAAAAILVVMFAVYFLLCSNYLFHRDVTINTEYGISDVTWQHELDEEHKESSRKFKHFTNYGLFSYRFDLYVDGKTIPAEISAMKTNDWEHDTVIIDIGPGDTDSEIKVNVHGQRIGDKTEQFDISDGKINLHIGP